MIEKVPIVGEELTHFLEAYGYLQEGKKLIARWDKTRNIEAKSNSVLAADNTVSRPYKMQNLMDHYLDVAIDSLRMLINIVEQEAESPTLPIAAHHSLSRSFLEASTKAFWLINSPDQQRRIERLLRLVDSEIKEEKMLMESALTAMNSSDPGLTKTQFQRHQHEINQYFTSHFESLEKCFVAAGIQMRNRDKILTPSTFLKEVGEELGLGEFIYITWKILSGLSHSSFIRSFNFSEKTVISELEDDVRYSISSSSLWFSQSVKSGFLTLGEALETYNTLKLKPYPKQ